MNKKDKVTIIVFVLLIMAILFVLGINSYKNRKLENVNRKIEYILGYTYDEILNKGENLFLQTLNLLINDSIFEYEKNLDESVKHYSINDKGNYAKIKNYSIILNNFSDSTLKEYMDYKDMIFFEDDYYIIDKKTDIKSYVGSILEIDNYDNNKINFKSINYYCDNYKFVGILDEVPNCNYTTSELQFSIILENNLFKVSSIENFKSIIK